jgi:outer membrane protein assembly factor BamA
LQATRDTRDNNLESHEGSYFQAGVYTEPQSGSTGWRADVIQLEGDARHFVDLGNDRVLALRANTGLTLGDPSYSFVYSLGGLNELRGYHSNRFRGKEFYGLQAELRFPIFPWLNGSTSLDGGDITDTQFNGTFLLTYQVGLRTDLLLKEGVVFRVDFGIGADQNEVQFNISEPF